MTEQGAEKAITVSALIVAAVYAYRKMTEPQGGQVASSRIAQLAGKGAPPPFGVFVTAWGFTFLVLSVVAAASPGLGGSMAILVATGDLLSNGTAIAKDVNTKVAPPPAPKTATGPMPAAQPQAKPA